MTLLVFRTISLSILLTMYSSASAAPNELFPFVISYDAPENVTNISSKLDAPAGKHGFVRAENGHFVTNQGRIRFWATTTCFEANFLEKEAADRLAARLARLGYGCIRLHFLDARDVWRKSSAIWGGPEAESRMKLDPVPLDRLDYQIAALKKKGIYVDLNLHVGRVLDERDGFPKVVNRPPHDKGIDNYYRPLIEANKQYARDLLEHVNPYTGNAYKDEPCIAMIETNNENSIVAMWSGWWGGMDFIRNPFLSALQEEWNDWLKAKYQSDAKLRKAWQCREEPFGNELLRNGNFSSDFIIARDGWNFQTDASSDATVSNAEGILRIDVRQPGNVFYIPMLQASGFGIEKGRLYTITMKARSNRESSVAVSIGMNHEPWTNLGCNTSLELSSDWQTYVLPFVAAAGDRSAKLSISSFDKDMIYEIDSVSLKPGGRVTLPMEKSRQEEMLTNGRFTRGYVPGQSGGWAWEADSGTKTSVANSGSVLRLEMRKKGEAAWSPQLCASGFGVEKEKEYVLVMTAKADRKTTLQVALRESKEPWECLGFADAAELSGLWRTFHWNIKPSVDGADVRLIFSGFEEGVAYEIDSVSLKAKKETQERECSLQRGTFPVIWKKEMGRYTPEARNDFCDFLMSVEARYWDEIRRFLKDEIKVKQPVCGTQLEFGSVHTQAKMDYCDIHAYWNHPEFPGRPFDGHNWYIRNRALVNHLDRMILPTLAGKRVFGKPYVVDEYNHPFPNQYGAEGLPLIAAFGAFQGWDAIFPFTYSHYSDIEPGKAVRFFDMAGHTTQLAHMIACHCLFIDGLNEDVGNDCIVAPLTKEKEREIFLRKLDPFTFDFTGLGLDARNALLYPIGIDVSGRVVEIPTLLEIPKDRKEFLAKKSPVNYCYYNMEKAGGGYASLCNQGGAVFTGFVEEGKEYPLLNGTVRFGKTNLGWATVSLAKVDRKANRMLLAATGEMINSGMKIEKLDGDKITVGDKWGSAPTLCEGIPATIKMKTSCRSLNGWALDESGFRKQEIEIKKIPGGFAVELKPSYKTVWYELEAVR